ATNSVNVFAAQATAANQSVNFQDAIGFSVGTVSAGGGPTNDRLFDTVPGAALNGIQANTASGTVRLKAATGNITQTQAITANALSAISTAGSIDLSLATNDVNVFAAQATAANQSVNYQDATGFSVGQVASGGLIPT